MLVAGEAKRGKSTFINALIGRPLLPTAVDIATSQVFRVAAADEPAYHLRFEDESRRAIDAANLARYGAHAAAGASEAPPLEQRLRWIEVDMPIRFLPPGYSCSIRPASARSWPITRRSPSVSCLAPTR